MKLWKKIVLIILAVIVLLFAIGYLYLFQFGGAEDIVNSEINDKVEKKLPLNIDIGEISGNILSGLEVRDISVRYTDSLYDFRMLYIPHLSLSHSSLLGFFSNDFDFRFIVIDSAQITLMKDDSGKFLIPQMPPSVPVISDTSKTTAEGKAKNPFRLNVGNFQLNSASVDIISCKDSLAIRNVDLVASIQSDSEISSLNIRRMSFNSNRKALQLEDARGKISLSEGHLIFHDVSISSHNTRMKVGGMINIEESMGQLEFDLDNIDLKQVTEPMGVKLDGHLDVIGSLIFDTLGFQATVDLGGQLLFMSLDNLHAELVFKDKMLRIDSLYGTLFSDAAIDGNGFIDFSQKPEKYELHADIKNFDLNKLIENSFESDISGRLELAGESFSNKDMVLGLDVDLYESSFDQYVFHKANGHLTITTDSISFADSFKINYYENLFTVTGSIDYDDELNLEVAADLKNLDRFRGQFFIDQPGGRGFAEVNLIGKTSSPDLTGYFVSDSVWIYDLYTDSMYADFNIDKFLSGRQGEVDVTLGKGSAWSVLLDSGLVKLKLDSTLVDIDSAVINNKYSQINTQGTYNYGTDPTVLNLNLLDFDLVGQEFKNQRNIIVNIDSLGFEFQQFNLGNEKASVDLAGRLNYNEELSLNVSVDRLPLSPWKTFIEGSYPVDGYLSCEANLSGTFLNPVFDIAGGIDSLVYIEIDEDTSQFMMGDLRLVASYDEHKVDIDSFLVLSERGRYFAHGFFNANLAFTSGISQRLPDDPFDITVTATDTRFDLVTILMPSVENLEGFFYADFNLSGTPYNPQLQGLAYLKNSKLKYYDLVDTIRTDSVQFNMQNNQISMDNIKLYIKDHKNGRKRNVYVDGDITVRSLDTLDYNLDINLSKEVPVRYELADIQGVVEGDLEVRGYGPPQVTGDLNLVSARYEANFADADAISPLMSALYGFQKTPWDLNIDVDIVSNYWIKNDDIDAEFAGDMNIVRREGDYRFTGQLEVLRGKAYLFDKTFRLQQGGTITFDNVADLDDGQLDIVAETDVTVTRYIDSEDQASPERIPVCLHVTGTVGAPELDPCEGSDLAKEDILPLLLMNSYASDGTTQATTGLEQRFSYLLAPQFSKLGTRILGVETFEINPTYEKGSLDLGGTQLTVGAYATQNLYLYGRTRFDVQRGQEVGFEYRINKSIMLEGQKDENELYQMDIKLHWEF